MKKFAPLLKLISKNLDLPQPEKSRILLEICGDMKDMYDLFISQGSNEQEAERKVKEKFEMTKKSLSELVDVHQTGFRRWMDKLSAQAQSRWERVIISIFILVIAVLGIKLFLSTPLLSESSYFIWIIFAIFLIISLLIILKIYQLYIKKDHRIKNLRSGLPAILFWGFMCLIIAATGYFIELLGAGEYNLLMDTKLVFLVANTEPNYSQILKDISQWSARSSSMVLVGLLVSMVSSIFWFIFENKASKIEQAEVEQLLDI
jgi:hypothetical protein